MARSNPLAASFHSNGENLPPSTLAAQIVQNQIKPVVARQNEQQALFASLLNEILHNSGAEIESDINTNVQLVKVLVEAGLAVLTHDAPFAEDIRLQQAKDSVSVIERTVRRQPEILVTSIADAGPPVCLWLLTQLLLIIGRPAARGLPAADLFISIVGVLGKSTRLWRLANPFIAVIQDCVNDIIEALESATVPYTVDIKLPPARSIDRLWPRTQSSLTASHDLQVSIRDVVQAYNLGSELASLPFLLSAWQQEFAVRNSNLLTHRRHLFGSKECWEQLVGRVLDTAPSSNDWRLEEKLVQSIALREEPISTYLQGQLAVSLAKVDAHYPTSRASTLNTTLSQLKLGADSNGLDEQLRAAIDQYLARQSSPEHEFSVGDHSITVSSAQSIRQVPRPGIRIGLRGQVTKRRRLDLDEDSRRSRILMDACEFFSVSQDTVSLAAELNDSYSRLTGDRRRAAWQHFSDLAIYEAEAISSTVQSILETDSLASDSASRTLCMRAIQLCVERCSRDDVIDLATSRMGTTCLRSLQSSSRDLRIAAGSCLPQFLRLSLPSDVRRENCRIALQWMRQLSDQDTLGVQETLVSAWGNVALVCQEQELNLVLLQLVDYLGHPNALIRGLTFVELRSVADRLTATSSVDSLLAPFWSSIAVSVVQDLVPRPQKCQMLCELIGRDVSDFLLETQTHILPFLVATKRKDILSRIAAARGTGTAIFDLFLQPRENLVAILSHLLCQGGVDSEDFAMPCLVAVEPRFSGQDLGDLVKMDSTAIACEILKSAGQGDATQKTKAHGAFSTLADLCERSPAQRRAHPRSTRSVSAFFERQILGILTSFSTSIESASTSENDRDKAICLKATAEMIALAKDKMSVALPQVRALLQSAIEQSTLCEPAWATWLTLLPVLNTQDIGSIIEQTFALLLRHWDSFSDQLRQSSHEVIAEIVPRNRAAITSRVTSLPSLSHIPLFSKIGGEIDHLQAGESIDNRFKSFSRRLRGGNSTVTNQALRDLSAYLEKNQSQVHDAAINEQPNQSLSDLMRTLLDVSVDLGTGDPELAELCGRALGLVGCLDAGRIEAMRKREHVLVLSNFDSADEVVKWVVFLLEHYLVKAFKSVTNAQAQGFMAYVIQELLKFCGFDQETTLRPRPTQSHRVTQRWSEMPEQVRAILTPFLSSKYTVTTSNSFNQARRKYPGFTKDTSHTTWLRGLVYDLTRRAVGENAKILFPHLARIVRGHDLAIADFLLPYIVLNIVLAGTTRETNEICNELLAILAAQAETSDQLETIKLCSESLFNVLDYMSIWIREKRRSLADTRSNAFRTGNSPSDFDEIKDVGQIETVANFLAAIPTQLVAARAMDCGSYARALFNWEQFIRQNRPLIPPVITNGTSEECYYELHDIYSRIDEPDGLEGISSHLSILSEEQQATLHARTGRWTAAQAWYESMLASDESNEALQEASLQCLRETGRFSTLLKYADSYAQMSTSSSCPDFLLPFKVEAAWRIDDMTSLRNSFVNIGEKPANDFALKLGRVLLETADDHLEQAEAMLKSLRIAVISGMTSATTNSLQTSHRDLKHLHILADVELINLAKQRKQDTAQLVTILQKRLDVLGAQNGQKQEVLAIQRLLLRSQNDPVITRSIAGSWLTEARLSRREGNIESAYYAVLRAAEAGDKAARLEEAKLLWHDGHKRQAISALEQAITAGIFDEAAEADVVLEPPVLILGTRQNVVAAKAHLLHAKWLDMAGQTQAKEMTLRYQFATKTCQKWEKGHYHLGKHYFRLLEAEKAMPKAHQNAMLMYAELPRLVIENLVRSVPFGNKYWFETIPKMLTLWLDVGMEAAGKASREDKEVTEKRKSALHSINKQLRKYFDRIPPYIFYSALPQMLSRISHPHPDVWKELSHIISRIVGTYPSQALWSLMAVSKATDKLRQERGKEMIAKLRSGDTRAKTDSVHDVRPLIVAGQRLSEGLLLASEAEVEQRLTNVSLSKDLGFNMRLAPCGLVVPIETTLSINLPPAADGVRIRMHKPFVHEKVTIQAFQDSVFVLSSLQRPKKLTLRGSDGKMYGLLCKPKDDLRKDQRLMEFNGIINRALKRDSAGSKRRLYIKTYAVTPLSEESGCLEWVDGIKPIRDILLSLYSRKNVKPNYAEIRNDLNEACSKRENVHIFDDKVQSKFQPALHEWFTEVFAEPESWFAARLRYARSAAVMSIVGHVLGLGDRHGENILLQESTGGVFHVDFNCLFDKGLTFEKPEVVPFRLTRNMVDAMGPYGHEGPFRKSCEVTLHLLRQNKDTLMTILETFLYDPTADFVGKKKKSAAGVPETPHDILDVVERKLRGLFKGETMPLSEEGYVDALIAEAVSSWNLCKMYIGWCAFL